MSKTKGSVTTDFTKTIVSSYEKDLLTFSSRHSGHWALRRFRMTGNPFYKEAILTDFQKRTLNNFFYLEKLSDKKFIKEESDRLLASYNGLSDRKLVRRKTFESAPELLFYSRVTAYLYFMHAYKIHKFKKIAPIFEQSIKQLKKVNWQKLLIDTDLVASHPTSLVNRAYYLYFTGIADIRKMAESRVKSYWLNRECDRDEEYQLKIYGMTHLVLGDSSYYQFAPHSTHSWILEYLRDNIEEVIRRTNPDIMCEVALCFLLLGHGTDPVVKKLKEEVSKYFNPKLGFIPRDIDNQVKESAEHRNMLAVLLFNYPSKFFEGPNLFEYMRETHRALYLPTSPLIRVGSSIDESDE